MTGNDNGQQLVLNFKGNKSVDKELHNFEVVMDRESTIAEFKSKVADSAKDQPSATAGSDGLTYEEVIERGIVIPTGVIAGTDRNLLPTQAARMEAIGRGDDKHYEDAKIVFHFIMHAKPQHKSNKGKTGDTNVSNGPRGGY